MLQLPDARPFSEDSAHMWKLTKQIRVVEQTAPEASCCYSVIFGNVGDGLSEVV
jgi:hypothetical protein